MRVTPWIYGAGAIFLIGYLWLCWIGIYAGVSSLDSYGAMRVAYERLQTGDFGISRPPGHPLTEYWLLPFFGWLVQGSTTLSSTTYGLYQLVSGLLCLVFFWLLLRELSLSPSRQLLALACLGFSPHFLIESSGGEEFLWAMTFFFGALVIVSKIAAGQVAHPLRMWTVALALAVAASGCRIEFGAVALGMVGWSLLLSDRSLREKLGLGMLTAVWLLALWAPVLLRHGANPPWAIPLDPKVRIEIGIYKIMFEAMGLLPMAVAAFFLLCSLKNIRVFPSLDKDLLKCWLPGLVLIFWALSFIYPMKPAVLLPATAFLILLVARQAGSMMWMIFVLACMSVLLTQVDCFKNRTWTGLRFNPSMWEQSLQVKPAFRGAYMLAASKAAAGGRHVVIADVWPWDFDWQQAHGFPLGRVEPGTEAQVYHMGLGMVASRAVLGHPQILQDYVRQGYGIWIDKDVYREIFLRYSLSTPSPETALIADIRCQVVELKN